MKQWPTAFFYQTDIEREVAMSINPEGPNVDMNSDYDLRDFLDHEIDVLDASIAGKFTGKSDIVQKRFREVGKPVRTLLLDMYDVSEALNQ